MLFYNSKKKGVDYNTFLILICALLVPLIVTGPFIPDAVVSILCIWFLYFSYKNNLKKIFKNKYFLFFIAFWLTCITSSLLSDDILFSLKSSLFFIRIGIFALLISYLISKDKRILDFFYFAFFFTFLALVIDGFQQYLEGKNLFGYELYGTRVSSFFKDELILGSYLTRLFPLFIALFLIRKVKNPLEMCAISILFISIYILVFLSGERTAFFLLNLSLFFIILFISKYKFLRLVFFGISLLAVIFITLQDVKLRERFVDSPIKSMGLESKKSQKYIFTPIHDSLIKTAWKMFLDKPVLGHGPKMFRLKCDDPKYVEGDYPCSTHPHNFYVQLLAETGLIGCSFLIGLLCLFIYVISKHVYFIVLKNRILLSDYQICLFAGLLISIWPITSSGNLFNNYLMLIYGLQIGFFNKK